ncbi:hypothetical protein [Paraburkholderia sp. GAS32]|uniref:hypothetical protein n=1 Tax=Paraburkholderia sp. GAS32 TaxID=3035129 RepID=UPI003D2312F8
MNAIIGTIHIRAKHQARAIERSTGHLFPLGAMQWIAAQATHYATVEGDDAMRFAIGLAGLAYSS